MYALISQGHTYLFQEEEKIMKKITGFIIILMVIAVGLFAAGAKDYPSRNINILVGYPAGGNTDLATRALADAAAPYLPKGVTFVVSNVVGDAGLIAFNQFANSRPDGYTLICANIDMAINYAIKRTEYGMDDWIPTGAAFYDPYGLVVSGNNPNYSDFKEFIDYVKANPGKVTIGHSGLGSTPNILADMFEKHFGVSVRQVPYNGTPDAVVAIVNGEIDAHFCQATPALSHIRAGTVRLVTMMTDQRNPLWPDVPTAKEISPNFDNKFIAWGFISAPKGTPPEVISFLRDAFDKAMPTPEFAKNMANLNQAVPPIDSRNMVQFVKEQYDLYQSILR